MDIPKTIARALAVLDSKEPIRQWAEELLLEHNVPIKLPDDAYVFHMHGGYTFSFIRLLEGNNPPTYSYLEGQVEFIRTHDRLTDYLAVELEIEKYGY